MLTDTNSILTEAYNLTTGARRDDYSHPAVDFSDTARIWSVILGQRITAAQVGLCMIGLKLSRESRRHKRDNLVDMAGYAATVNMLYETNQVG